MEIPLRDRYGRTIAIAHIDDAAAGLAAYRWYRLRSGYAVRTVIEAGRKRMLYLHREVLRADGTEHVDHIDGDRLNNRRSNLRTATPALNAQNRGSNGGRQLPRNVYAKHGQFTAQCKIGGRAYHLGSFATVEEATAVVTAWRAQHMPYSADARLAAPVVAR